MPALPAPRARLGGDGGESVNVNVRAAFSSDGVDKGRRSVRIVYLLSSNRRFRVFDGLVVSGELGSLLNLINPAAHDVVPFTFEGNSRSCSSALATIDGRSSFFSSSARFCNSMALSRWRCENNSAA